MRACVGGGVLGGGVLGARRDDSSASGTFLTGLITNQIDKIKTHYVSES